MAEQSHSDFETAFTEGLTLVDVDGVRYATRTLLLGELRILSGAIGVGDAFTGVRPVSPPSGRVPLGVYAVELALARFETDGGACVKGDERVAAARVRLSPAKVASWRLADGGAEVDSGTCAFIDGDTKNWTPGDGADALEAALQESTVGPSVMAAHRMIGGRAVTAFSSGYGDGVYPAYWGLDAAGVPAAFCLDFEVLLTDETVDVPLGWPLRRGAIRDPRLRTHEVTARVPWLGGRRLVYGYSSARSAYARWRLPDGSWRRPAVGESLGRHRRATSLVNRPDGAELVLRIVTGHRPCTRAP
jgi:hypothetical protein